MESPDFSDSDESTCSSGSSSIDSAPKQSSLHPKTTDLGKRVVFTGSDKKQKFGVLRYLGEPEFSEGLWCGVVLDQPQGKNNGSVHGIRYFTCEPNYGVFVPVDKVEVDTSGRRSRSRPNSQPGSRASSVERKGQPSRPSSASKPVQSQGFLTSSSATSSASLGPSSKMNLSMQQDLANRLSQPTKRHAQSHVQTNQNSLSGSRRVPMKAFAPKGMEEISVKENKKPLMPFRPGGMYKASSSENIRSMKSKDRVGSKSSSNKLSQGMPSKKSSSERDLRNAGKSSSVPSKPVTSSATLRPKRKQARMNSCSDILSSDTTSDIAKSDLTDLPSRKVSCDYTWPRTSTPGNRDELTPDGCSSPEETDDSYCKRTDSLNHDSHNNGFVEPPAGTTSSNGSGTKNGSGLMQEGLATHAKQFAESERNSPSLPHCMVQSPGGTHSKQCYSNRLSGSATLSHPLTNSLITDGAHLLKQLLGTKKSLDGVSVDDLAALFDQQIHQWQHIVADLEEKLDQEKARSKQLEEQIAGGRVLVPTKQNIERNDLAEVPGGHVHSSLWDKPGLSNGTAARPIPSM